MIDNERYKRLLESGLALDHYFLLCNIKNGNKITETKRIQGFTNLLTKKGYLSEGTLTDKGIELVEHCEFTTFVEAPTVVLEKKSSDLVNWATRVHAALRANLKRITGTTQAYLEVQGRKYPYLPGPQDLAMKVEKFIKVYGLKDLKKIEDCLMKHCEVRNQKMIYYIIREKGDAKSDLAADYERLDDKEDINDDDGRIDPKTLF